MSGVLGRLSSQELYAIECVAYEIGDDVNNPDGGLTRDASDEVILETVCDVVQGGPYCIKITLDDLSGAMKRHILDFFWKGANEC